MSNRIKRLRVFAGPNGSGKSTLYDYLIRIGAFHPYYFINADNIARDLSVCADFTNYPFDFTDRELVEFLDVSSFQNLTSCRLSEQLIIKNKMILLKNDQHDDIFPNTHCGITSNITYLSAALADFIRQKMILSDSSFSFESVFSHPSKISELENAKKKGFKTYMYFVAMADPRINCQRIQNRVQSGGHSVPVSKIKERFYRTMENIYPAFCLCDEVFFFDNSSERSNGTYSFFAEKNDDTLLYTDFIPKWFDEWIIKKL